jgi:hypothetical protein
MTDAAFFAAVMGCGPSALPDGRGSDKHFPTVHALPSRAR